MQALESIAQLAKKHDILPKKSLGQNFIYDLSLCKKIADSANIKPDDVVLEIGPGTGGLTRGILEANPARMIAIEKDTRCRALLAEIGAHYPKLEVIEDDALTLSLSSLKDRLGLPQDQKFKIIANLPYNIATQIIINYLHEASSVESMNLMVQKEVAQRIVSKVGIKSYGRLSVFCQVTAYTKLLFDVSPESFYPRPKVTSSIVSIIPKEDAPDASDLKLLSEVTQAAFSMRRKMIRGSLAAFLKSAPIREELLNQRAENLSPEEYLAYARSLR